MAVQPTSTLFCHKTEASTTVECIRLIDQSYSRHQKARSCERNLSVEVVVCNIHHILCGLPAQIWRPLLGAGKTPVCGAERTLCLTSVCRDDAGHRDLYQKPWTILVEDLKLFRKMTHCLQPCVGARWTSVSSRICKNQHDSKRPIKIVIRSLVDLNSRDLVCRQ